MSQDKKNGWILFISVLVKGASYISVTCKSMEIDILEGTITLILSIVKHILTSSKNLFLHEICTVWRVNDKVYSVKVLNQGAIYFLCPIAYSALETKVYPMASPFQVAIVTNLPLTGYCIRIIRMEKLVWKVFFLEFKKKWLINTSKTLLC